MRPWLARCGPARARSASSCAHAVERRVVAYLATCGISRLEQGAGMEMYIPDAPMPTISASVDLGGARLAAPADMAAGVRAALKPIVPNLPGNDFRMLQTLVDRSVSPRRFVAALLGGFALFALLLASLGIYGVVSYGVTQRTQEIGIRMAFGSFRVRPSGCELLDRRWSLAAIGMAIGGVRRRSWRGLSADCSSA